MTTAQLMKLFCAIFSLLPLSFQLMCDYSEEFKDFFKVMGNTFAENIRNLSNTNEIPDIETLAESSLKPNLEALFPFLSSFLSGLGGPLSNKILTQSIIESIRKLVEPDYNSLIGWRDSIILYVRSRS